MAPLDNMEQLMGFVATKCDITPAADGGPPIIWCTGVTCQMMREKMQKMLNVR